MIRFSKLDWGWLTLLYIVSPSLLYSMLCRRVYNMLYKVLCTGRTTGPAGHTSCKCIQCKWIPHSRACQEIQGWSYRVERFDLTLWAQHLPQVASGCGVGALLQGSATPGYCSWGRAAVEGSHLRRSHEGRDSEASQGWARGRLLKPKIPGS